MSKISILGLSGSLRNARFRRGSLISGKRDCRHRNRERSRRPIWCQQTKIRADDFLEAGLSSGAPFDEVYRALHKKRFERGLSNSEAATATALWAAHRAGAQISRISGSLNISLRTGRCVNQNRLAAALRAADGIIVSSPVYFGDRGSLVQSLFEFIASDPEPQAGHGRQDLRRARGRVRSEMAARKRR